MPSAKYHLCVLGPFRLLRNGQSVDLSALQRRQQSLLRLLAVSPQHVLRREQVIDTFWPELSPEAGGSNLRYTLHKLRRSMVDWPPLVVVSQGQVCLNPASIWKVDIEELENLLAGTPSDTDLDRAAELFRGEPLAEERYEDWARPAQEHAARLWRRLCCLMVTRHERNTNLDQAIAWQERLVDTEPLDEEAFVTLVGLLVRAGRRAEALRRYRAFSHSLEEELGTGPAEETQQQVNGLLGPAHQAPFTEESHLPVEQPDHDTRAQPATTVPDWDVQLTYPLPDASRVIGRDEELAQLKTWIQPAGSQSSLRLIGIEAEAGLGKTWLLGALARRAREEGWMVLAGAFYDREGVLPLGALRDALLDLLRLGPDRLPDLPSDILQDLLPIMPSLRGCWEFSSEQQLSGDPALQRLHLFSAVERLLNWIAERRPLVLILDDVHWTDEQNLQMLHFLVRSPSTELSRLRVALAYRVEESPAALADLMMALEANGTALRLPLKPLSLQDLEELIGHRLGGRIERRFVQHLHARTLGNPFFALQISRLLQQRGDLQRSGDLWLLSSDGAIDLPEAVRRTILRRLSHLPEEVQKALALGSVVGDRFSYAVLEQMWSGTHEDLLRAMDVALAAYLVQEAGEEYVFRHPLLREAIYDSLSHQRRRSLHHLAGRALESTTSHRTPRDIARLAYHFATSQQRPQKSLEYSMLAAEQAEAAAAHPDAVHHYRNALASARVLGDREAEATALERLGIVERSIGEPDDALSSLEAAADLQRELGNMPAEVRVTHEVAIVQHFRGRWEDGLPRVLSLQERFQSWPERPRFPLSECILSNSLARLYLPSRCPPSLARKALDAAGDAVELCERFDDAAVASRAWLLYGWALECCGRDREALQALDKSERKALQSGRLLEAVAAAHMTGLTLINLRELRRAADALVRGFGLAVRRGGVDQLANGVAEATLESLTLLGRWEDVLELSSDGLRLAEAFGQPRLPAVLLPWRAAVRVYRGEYQEGIADLEEGVRRLPACSPETQADYRMLEYKVRSAMAVAQDNVSELNRLLKEWGESFPEDPSYWLAKTLYLLDVKKLDEAEEAAVRAMAKHPGRWTRLRLPDALCAKGGLEHAMGRISEARHSLDKALAEARGTGYRLAEARILIAQARILIDRREHTRARHALDEAEPILRELRANPFLTELAQLRDQWQSKGAG